MDNDATGTSDWENLSNLIVSEFESMPRQLQTAARFVLDHPKEAAIASVREQARRAGVSHTTMVRLAVWLGLDNFEQLRRLCLQALQGNAAADRTFVKGPARSAARLREPTGIVRNMTARLSAHFEHLTQQAIAAQFIAPTNAFVGANTVYALGLRAEQMVAQRFAYLRTLTGQATTVLEAGGVPGVEALRQASGSDVLLAIGMAPYSRDTVELVQLAVRQNLTVIAITDSRLSPLATRARETILVPENTQFPFPSIAPAIVAAELLAVLIAEREGTLGNLLRSDDLQAGSGVFWNSRNTDTATPPRNRPPRIEPYPAVA